MLWPLLQKLLSKRRLFIACAVTILLIPIVTVWPSGIFMRNHMTEMMFLYINFPIGGILSEVMNGVRRQLTWPQRLSMIVGGLALWVVGTYIAFHWGTQVRLS